MFLTRQRRSGLSALCALRLCFLVGLWAGAALAVDFAALKPEGYVSDFARVLDASGRMELEQYCAQVERSTGAELALVTLPTLDGEPVDDVANSLFRRWGIGKKGKNEGALLLLVVRDKRSRLEVGYGLEPIIPDGFAGGLLRAMRPYLRQQQYGAALFEAAQQLGGHIAQAKGVSLEGPAPRPVRRRGREFPPPSLLLMGGLLAFLLFSSLFGRGGGGGGGFLTGMLLGNLLGGGFGSGRGGGGFGGFDSGDGGFGGFGGGDSGGGGASSDW